MFQKLFHIMQEYRCPNLKPNTNALNPLTRWKFRFLFILFKHSALTKLFSSFSWPYKRLFVWYETIENSKGGMCTFNDLDSILASFCGQGSSWKSQILLSVKCILTWAFVHASKTWPISDYITFGCPFSLIYIDLQGILHGWSWRKQPLFSSPSPWT